MKTLNLRIVIKGTRSPTNIRNIPVLSVRKLALKYARENRQNKDLSDQELLDLDLIGAFEWSNTPEGHHFWNHLDIALCSERT